MHKLDAINLSELFMFLLSFFIFNAKVLLFFEIKTFFLKKKMFSEININIYYKIVNKCICRDVQKNIGRFQDVFL